MYPEAQTTVTVPNDPPFTEISYQEVDTTEDIKVSRTESTDNETTTTPAATTTSSTSSMTVATRRHNYPIWLPILTCLRYSSTIWVSEIATTCFENPCIHHSAVSNRGL